MNLAFSDSSSIVGDMSDTYGDALFGSKALGITFHPYQLTILDVIKSKLKQGERRIHIVAPPGSGKTLIGLAAIETIRRKALVLSPNTTIQAQWVDKAARFFVDTDPLAPKDNLPLVSADPQKVAPILSLTYQLFASRESRDGDEENLFNALVQFGYRTIVLDECHHLTNHWAEMLLRFLKRHKDATVIALTATPPIDSSDTALQRYLEIVGAVDVEIPLPAIVRDGMLCPFQDLARFVVPTERELATVRRVVTGLGQLTDLAERAPAGVESLSLWIEQQLHAPFWAGKSWPDFFDFCLEHPQAGAALVRYWRSRGLTLPTGVIDPDEAAQPLTMHDIGALMDGYLDGYVANIKIQTACEFRETLAGQLAALGFEKSHGRYTIQRSPISRALAFSRAKLLALREILTAEAEALGEELRALVLLDFVHTNPGETTSDDPLGADAGGAVAAFRALVGDPRTDELDPILVTGQVILVDDDIAARVLGECNLYLQGRQSKSALSLEPGDGFYQLVGRGTDWGTRLYVEMVTDLLTRGVTRCVVGTRALLGEGWDCEVLNTLVDLTNVSAFVTVNQVRGRTLRLDPRNPAKTANNWDVVAVIPNVAGGESDLERFEKKHQRFFGPADDGVMQKGVGHVHPALTHLGRNEFVEAMDKINAELMQRAASREQTHQTWRVGERYVGDEITALDLVPQPRRGVGRRKGPRRAASNNLGTVTVVDERRVPKTGFTVVGGFALLATAFLALGAQELTKSLLGLLGGLLIGTTLSVILNWWWLRKRIAGALRTLTMEAYIAEIAESLREALFRTHQLVSTAKPVLTVRSDESLRLQLDNAGGEDTRRFSESARELFGPYQKQRYLLVCWAPSPPRSPWAALTWHSRKQRVRNVTFPIPTLLGAQRKYADLLAEIWTRRSQVATAEFVGTRETKSASLPILLPLAENRPSLKRFLHEMWH